MALFSVKPDTVTDAKSDTIDLRSDNRIKELLEEYEDSINMMSEARERYIEARTEIFNKLGTASKALVDGWRLRSATRFRKAFAVKATTFKVLLVKRKSRRSPTV